jgi:hypothetical protein
VVRLVAGFEQVRRKTVAQAVTTGGLAEAGFLDGGMEGSLQYCLL